MDEFLNYTHNDNANINELKRLADNHETIKDTMGKLVLAPVDFSKPGLRILDSACANGLWLRDLQSSIATPHTYIGIDIVKELFPTNLPPGITLVVQSFTDPWPPDWTESFDLIHQRFALAAAGFISIKTVLRNFVGLLKPGAWIQLIEMELDGAESNAPASRDFLQLLKDIFNTAGVGGDFVRSLRKDLREAGLEEVEERLVDVPSGARNPNPDLVVKSTDGACNAVPPMVAMAKTFPTSFTAEQLSSLERRLREESKTMGAIYRMRVVWGRKPGRGVAH